MQAPAFRIFGSDQRFPWSTEISGLNLPPEFKKAMAADNAVQDIKVGYQTYRTPSAAMKMDEALRIGMSDCTCSAHHLNIAVRTASPSQYCAHPSSDSSLRMILKPSLPAASSLLLQIREILLGATFPASVFEGYSI